MASYVEMIGSKKRKHEKEEETDKIYSVGSSSDSEEGLLPASKWQYLNLKDTNIFYNDKPEPLKEFMQNVKTDITMEFPNFDKKPVEKFCRLTTENLLFIFDVDAVCKDFDTICKQFSGHKQIKIMVEQSFMADVKTNIERAGRVDKDLDHTSV